MARVSKTATKQIKLDLIDEPAGIIRMEIESENIKDLAESIREIGLLQPIIVRPDNERFEIVFGHRRYLAHKALKARSIACIVRVLSDVECAVMRATENIQRVNLTPIEEGAIYSDLHDRLDLSYEQIGKYMGPTAGVVRRRMDLLRMPPEVQQAIHRKQISVGVAEELWSIGDPEGISYYLGHAIDHGVTVAVARLWAQDWKKAKRTREGDVEGRDPLASPMELPPTYIACDFCSEPVELGKDIVLRGCSECVEKIKAALRG